MTQIVLNIENMSIAQAIRSLVKNLAGVRIVSDTQSESLDISENDITSRIANSLKQVKLIQEGKLPRRSVQDMINGI